jgi:hypothetical protein
VASGSSPGWLADRRAIRLVRHDPGSPVDTSHWPATVPAVEQQPGEGLELPEGLTMLVGENGSGKSTVTEMLAEACGLNRARLPSATCSTTTPRLLTLSNGRLDRYALILDDSAWSRDTSRGTVLMVGRDRGPGSYRTPGPGALGHGQGLPMTWAKLWYLRSNP